MLRRRANRPDVSLRDAYDAYDANDEYDAYDTIRQLDPPEYHEKIMRKNSNMDSAFVRKFLHKRNYENGVGKWPGGVVPYAGLEDCKCFTYSKTCDNIISTTFS